MGRSHKARWEGLEPAFPHLWDSRQYPTGDFLGRQSPGSDEGEETALTTHVQQPGGGLPFAPCPSQPLPSSSPSLQPGPGGSPLPPAADGKSPLCTSVPAPPLGLQLSKRRQGCKPEGEQNPEKVWVRQAERPQGAQSLLLFSHISII